MDGCAQASPQEIADDRRRCWAHVGGETHTHRCKRTARLEKFGWRYCVRHYWQYEIRGWENWGHLWEKIRNTEIACHKRRP